jgi:hypothetical protein
VRSERPRRLWDRARWTEERWAAARRRRSAVSREVAVRKLLERALFRSGSSQASAAERTRRSVSRLGGGRDGGYFSRRRARSFAVLRPSPRRLGYTPNRPRRPLFQGRTPSEIRGAAELPRTRLFTSGGRLPSTGFGSFPAYGGLGAPQGGPNSRAGVVRFDLTAARCGAPAAQRLIERVGEQLTGPSDGRPRIRRTRTRLVRGQGSRSERTDG